MLGLMNVPDFTSRPSLNWMTYGLPVDPENDAALAMKSSAVLISFSLQLWFPAQGD